MKSWFGYVLLAGRMALHPRGAGWDECVVIDCDQIVVGRLRKQAWHAADSTTANHVMEPGPTTVRPDQLLDPLVGRMRNRGTQLVLVTTPQGHSIGAVMRKEAEQLLNGGPPEQIWRDCDACPRRRIVAG